MRIATPLATTVLLSFIASFVDTTGFIALFSLFTAHVTGNFVVIAAEFSGPTHGVATKLLALPTFVLAVASAQAVCILHETRPKQAALMLLLAQAVLLLLLMVLGLMAWPVRSPDAPLPMAAGLVGVLAMGFQNALVRTPMFATLAPSTVMTGNVTQATMDLIDLLIGSPDDRAVARPRLAKTWPAILAFAAGAGAAPLTFAWAGFGNLIAPVVLLMLVAALVTRSP